MSPHALHETPPGLDHLHIGKNCDIDQDVAPVHLAFGEAKPSHKNNGIESHLRRVANENNYDLVCIGFGPANLALAIAIHDAIDGREAIPGLTALQQCPPKILFLERQNEFGWHKGMLLPGSKMQISFIKDLATLRNPRSDFTFLNYLHKMGRLATFTNLGTFLPQRIEFEDYMKWCASAFDEVVDYSSEVVDIIPEPSLGERPEITNKFSVTVRDLKSGDIRLISSKKVVCALGGTPQLPDFVPPHHPKILHSAEYAVRIHNVLQDRHAPYTIAVVGSGQSAAEVFKDLHSRFPASKTRLIVTSSALKPSDDSPFVNEAFNPERVDEFFEKSSEERKTAITEDRSTNYSVVRISLLEELYEELYMQRLTTPDSNDWQHNILTNRVVEETYDVSEKLRMVMSKSTGNGKHKAGKVSLDVDAIVFATGYHRNSHEALLRHVAPLTQRTRKAMQPWPVGRDFKLALDEKKINAGVGVWLSGCNEATHGISDSLLSVLANRGGELMKSIFGD